jgi:putative phosphoribosyl transferase
LIATGKACEHTSERSDLRDITLFQSHYAGWFWHPGCTQRRMNTTLEHLERKAISVRAGDLELIADLALPEGAIGFVLFAHGSGSSRKSPRNRHVAQILNRGSIGTLLIDLLTGEEEKLDIQTAQLRFDINLLARRVSGITDWIAGEPDLKKLKLGYFGASTGAAAALVAAAARPAAVHAVVSRGGRPDLAGDALWHVTAPSLFIVGGDDSFVLDLNREAMSCLPAETERRLEVIPAATHLFEEPGALDRVAVLARDWFRHHLGGLILGPGIPDDCPRAAC